MKNEKGKSYYEKNKEKILASRKRYYQENKNKILKYQSDYYNSKNYKCKKFGERLLKEDNRMIVIKCVVLDKLRGTRERILKVNSNTIEEAIKRISRYYDIVSYEVLKQVMNESLILDEEF